MLQGVVRPNKHAFSEDRTTSITPPSRVVTIRTSKDGVTWTQDWGCADAQQSGEPEREHGPNRARVCMRR